MSSVISKVSSQQSLEILADNTADLTSVTTLNPSAYNSFNLIYRGLGSKLIKGFFAVLANPLSPGTVLNYKINNESKDFGYSLHVTSKKWARETSGVVFDILVSPLVAFFPITRADRPTEHDLGEVGTTSVVTQIKGRRAVDPIDHECVVRSSWIDFDRQIEIQHDSTMITDEMTLKNRYVSPEQAQSREFLGLLDNIKDCLDRSRIVTYLNPAKRSPEQVEADSLKGPSITKMTNSEAEVLLTEVHSKMRPYLLRKVFRYSNHRIAAEPKDPYGYWLRAKSLLGLADVGDGKILTGFVAEAKLNLVKGLALGTNPFDPKFWLLRVQAEVADNQLAQAAKDFRQLYAKAPHDFDTFYAGFVMTKALHDLISSERWIRLAIASAKNPIDQIMTLRSLAELLAEGKHHKEALEIYLQMLNIPEISVMDLQQGASEATQIDDVDKGIDFDRKALAAGDNPKLRESLSVCCPSSFITKDRII